MEPQPTFDGLGFDMPQYNVQQAQQLYGGYNMDGSSISSNINSYSDPNDLGSYDENDPKRRRIARVCALPVSDTVR